MPQQKKLRRYIRNGHRAQNVLAAYGVSQITTISLDELLTGETIPSAQSRNGTVQEISDFTEAFGLNADAVVSYAQRQNLSSENIKDLFEQTLEEQLIEFESDASEYNPADDGIWEANDPKQYADAPFVYNHKYSESVSLNTGALIYTHNDFVLPGKDGFDFAISRQYDSSNSNTYDMDILYNTVTKYQGYVRIDAWILQADEDAPILIVSEYSSEALYMAREDAQNWARERMDIFLDDWNPENSYWDNTWGYCKRQINLDARQESVTNPGRS